MLDEIENLKLSVEENAKVLTDVFAFDVIKIVNLDIDSNELFETLSIIKNPDCTAEAFKRSDIAEIIRVLIEKKESLILEKEAGDASIVSEVYIPFFSCDHKTMGFIYGAGSKVKEMITEPDLMCVIKLLSNNCERILFLNKKLENLYGTVLMLCELINAKQPFLIGNLNTVYHWAQKIAVHMNLKTTDLNKLQLATLMHDLGKIYISESILNKTGKYTEEEYKIIQTRVTHSYEISLKLMNIYPISDIPEIILNYQERIDGKGYPNGLTGDNIPLLSKILGVAKAVSAMLSNTLYRKAMPIDAVINELKNNSGTQFDTAVAEAAIVLLIYKKTELADYFSGLGTYATLSVTLDDGRAINTWGNVRKKGESYQFNPVETVPDFELNEVTSSQLYINVDERIIKYKAEINKASTRSLSFSKLRIQENEKTFSINWFIEADYLTKDGAQRHCYIILIGGNCLDFYVFADQVPESLDSGFIAVKLTDEHVSQIPGVIVYSQKVNEKVYYRFEYRGLTETEERRIFSAIFNKQLEVKRLIKETNYFKKLTGTGK